MDLRARISELMPRAREELTELVAMRSVADPRQFPPEECERAAHWVRAKFGEIGFTDAHLRELKELFTERATSPFDGDLPREVTKDAQWVEPSLVGEVAYGQWTADGRLRHPSWRGLREDVDPEDVVVEW